MELSASEQQKVQVKVKLVSASGNSLCDDYETKENVQTATSDAESQISQRKPGNARKDLIKIIFLIYLYFLQGIPLGLRESMPFLLSARGVSYSDQGTFSFSIWPSFLKILWAPIIDSMYIKRIGRRKSWLVPVYFFMALFLFTFADHVQYFIDEGKTRKDIMLLTTVFVVFIFLASAQDIALDGWAVSMLSKENVAWQATCQFVGQAFGFILGHIIFIILESKQVSNKYIRPFFNLPLQNEGIITLKMFMVSFGFIFLVTTFMILVFIDEKKIRSSDFNENESESKYLGIFDTYKMILKMLGNKRVQQFAFVVLTSRIGWATDAALFMKLIDYGVSKETIVGMIALIIPVNVLWPLVIGKWTNGPKPLMVYAKLIPIKLFVAALCCLFMYGVRFLKNEQCKWDYTLYLGLLFIFTLNTCVDVTRGTSLSAFMATITDESIGGTYFTFLRTLEILGGSKGYPALVLFLINWLSQKYCDYEHVPLCLNKTVSVSTSTTTTTTSFILKEQYINNTCSTTLESTICKESGGICVTTLDAFYYLTIFMISLGTVWFLVFRKMFRELNNSRKSEWKLVR